MADTKLPAGIVAVHKNYNPDKERMVKALRIVLEAAARDKVEQGLSKDTGSTGTEG